MTQKIVQHTNNCIKMRNGIEIWVDDERLKKLQTILENIKGTKFINIDKQTVNTADIIGIFDINTIHKEN